MDPLASSHTETSRSGRHLLVMFFALVLFRYAVADASDSRNIQGVHSASKDSAGQLRIRGEQAGRTDYLQQIRLERSAKAGIRPPATGKRLTEVTRKILGDISPPGMWPSPDGQDDVPPVVNDEFRRRSLLTGGTSSPPLGPWLVVMHSSQDREDAFLRDALVADKTYPLVNWASMVNKLRQLGTVISRTSVGLQIRLPGSLRVNGVVAEHSVDRIELGDEQPRTVSERVVVPDADRTSPDTVGNDMRSSAGHFEESASLQREIRAGEPKFRSRSLLQGDISPPGMWPDADDDESQLSESVLLGRRRRLMNM